MSMDNIELRISEIERDIEIIGNALYNASFIESRYDRLRFDIQPNEWEKFKNRMDDIQSFIYCKSGYYDYEELN